MAHKSNYKFVIPFTKLFPTRFGSTAITRKPIIFVIFDTNPQQKSAVIYQNIYILYIIYLGGH